MSHKELNENIYLKQYISEKEYEEINKLSKLCYMHDKTNLKLELDYKLNMAREITEGLKEVNEFLYYVDGVLVAYLGISCFGGNIGEINGMTHPEWRRKGIFGRLFNLSIEECKKRNYSKILLLADGKSESGNEFIKAVGGSYDFSEYRMKQCEKINLGNTSLISLKMAEKGDGKEIAKQNAIFFNDSEAGEDFIEEEGFLEKNYMIQLKDESIGKINVDYNDNSAFIFGFGILQAFRGKGYGKAALKETLRMINEKNISNIELDVECKNDTALNLYKACGFEEKSVMNYYKLVLK